MVKEAPVLTGVTATPDTASCGRPSSAVCRLSAPAPAAQDLTAGVVYVLPSTVAKSSAISSLEKSELVDTSPVGTTG